jgi:hypothetical protein
MFNLDKTGIRYNSVVHTILAYAGRLTTIAMAKKHSGTLMALLGVDVFSKKLLILFI